MKLPDINFWLALVISSHKHHAEAKAWLEEQQDDDSIAVCRVTQQGYLRILTKSEVMRHYQMPTPTNREAWASWASLLEDHRIFFHSEPLGLERWWEAFGACPTASSNLWMDTYLAAFAVAANLELVTFDQGFNKFDGLKLVLLSD